MFVRFPSQTVKCIVYFMCSDIKILTWYSKVFACLNSAQVCHWNGVLFYGGRWIGKFVRFYC